MQTSNLRTAISLAVLALVVGGSGCEQAEPSRHRPIEPAFDDELPVLQRIEGVFDGEELTFRTIEVSDELEAAGVSQPLVNIPSLGCSTCTGSDYVAFSNATGRHTRTNGVGTWDTANCGTTPTSGVCQNVRLRNLYAVQLERVYASLLTLTPTGSTTSVTVPTHPYLAASDFGAAPIQGGALWRFGEVGRASPTTGGQTLWWPFTGTTTGTTFTFRFTVEVRGLIVPPTRRATLANGASDNPGSGGYTSQTALTIASGTSVALSESGQFAAFIAQTGTTRTVYRKNLTTGALQTVVAGCGSGTTDLDISGDGSVVVFQANGCNPLGFSPFQTAPQVYAYDFNTSTLSLVSQTIGGAMGAGTSSRPRVSTDGTTVVYRSGAPDLVFDYVARGLGCADVYRHDLGSLETVLVSKVRDSDFYDTTAGWTAACTGSAPAGDAPDVSADGGMIVFASSQPIDPADGNSARDFYVYDHFGSAGSGIVLSWRVSLTSAGGDLNTTLPATALPVISSDGAWVAFSSAATNINPSNALGATSAGRVHVYRRSSAEDANGSIQRVSRIVDPATGANGAEPSGSSSNLPELSSSGRYVAFWSSASNLAAYGTYNPGTTQQVYVCDMGAADPGLRRCFVASTVQPTPASAFAPLSGTISSTTRIGFGYPIDGEEGFVAYTANPTSWTNLNASGLQMFVSPVGDPRYQQPTIAR